MTWERPGQLIERALTIGADPADSADERFRKRLLVGVALIILPAGLLWGYLYWVADELDAALLPWAYVAGSVGEPRRLRANAQLRVPPGGAAPPDPRRPRAADRRARRSRGVERRDPVVAARAARRRRVRPARRVPGRGSRRSSPRGARGRRALRSRAARRSRPARRLRPDRSTSLNIVAVSLVAMVLLVTLRARAGRGAGARRGAPAQHPPERGRGASPGGFEHDRGPLRRREHPVRRRRRLHAALRAVSTRARSSGCSTGSSRPSTSSSTATTSRRSRRSATATWSRPASPRLAPTTRRRLPALALEMRECARTLPARTSARDLRLRIGISSGPGRRGRDRPPALPLRPVGRHGEHGEPHGVARDTGRDPDHALDLGAPAETTS